jgi:hypothetical protein
LQEEGTVRLCVKGHIKTSHSGFNSVFLAVKRKALGFRSADNLIAMLYFTAGRLDIPFTY